jgi:hypothetical protein
LKAIGRKERDWKENMRICNIHSTKKVKYTKKYSCKGKDVSLCFTFEVPDSDGILMMKDNKADRHDTAYDRATMHMWEKRKKGLKALPGHGDAAVERIVELEKNMQLSVDQGNNAPLNDSIKKYFGIIHSPDYHK